MEAILSSINIGKIMTSLNHTFLTLIPKVKYVEKVSEFRPIALCNILYKLISKVLANRLKHILPLIISESRSVFQSDKAFSFFSFSFFFDREIDKAISDNILVSFETLHHMKTKKSGKTSFLTMKLDMSKAYDKVEWNFLLKIMEQMGFHSR